MTGIIFRFLGLLVVLASTLVRDAAIVDAWLRRVAMMRSEINRIVARLVRHLHHPPARWAAS